MLACGAKRDRSRRGTALLVAMTVAMVLVALALAIHRKVSQAIDAGDYRTGRSVLSEAAVGAVHTAMAVLVEDKRTGQTDSLAELWADPAKVSALAAPGALEGVRLQVSIDDECAKLQVNALVDFPHGRQIRPAQQQLWERFLGLAGFSELRGADEQPAMMVNALKDWLDSGDDDAITGLSGAEASFYETLPTPYTCRNGPLSDVDEMRLIRWIGPQLLDGREGQPGIAPFVTVFGADATDRAQEAYPGRININTAPPAVIMALVPEEYQDLAEAIDTFRKEILADDTPEVFNDPLWYRNAPGCRSLTIDPELITTASDYFQIRVAAARADLNFNLSVVIARDHDANSGLTVCRIIRWQSP